MSEQTPPERQSVIVNSLLSSPEIIRLQLDNLVLQDVVMRRLGIRTTPTPRERLRRAAQHVLTDLAEVRPWAAHLTRDVAHLGRALLDPAVYRKP